MVLDSSIGNIPVRPGIDYFIGGESMMIRLFNPVRAFGFFSNAQLAHSGETDFISLKNAAGRRCGPMAGSGGEGNVGVAVDSQP